MITFSQPQVVVQSTTTMFYLKLITDFKLKIRAILNPYLNFVYLSYIRTLPPKFNLNSKELLPSTNNVSNQAMIRDGFHQKPT
jgi:hypothetical protein